MYFFILICFGCYFVYKKFLGEEPEKPLKEQNWKKDLIYLNQFPCADKFRSISPFALKLETWLRMTKIPYESRYTNDPSKKGQIPYIELNGKEYADSNLIIDMLSKKFDVNPDSNLKNETPGTVLSHTIQMMVENHTAFYGFYWRYALNGYDFFGLMRGIPSHLRWLLSTMLGLKIRLRFYLHGISRHSQEEMNEFSFKDLKAISDCLGEKKYILSDDNPTNLDATLFGHLVQFLYIPMDFPQKTFVREQCPNLVKYVDRIREEFWPDWDEMCAEKCMEGKKRPET